MIKRKKIIIPIILLILLYFVFGMLAPFFIQPEVNDNWKDNFSAASFYGGNSHSSERAGVVEDNKDALDLRIKMFEEAQTSIILSTFDIRPGKSCTDIFSALYAAAERGVKVQVFVDGLYGSLNMAREPIFYAAGSHPNFEIRFYNIPNPLLPWTTNGRMHDKYILVDEDLLLMGGRNTFDYFLGDYTNKNVSYDREVLIYQQNARQEGVIHDVSSYFSSIWNSEYSKTVYEKDKSAQKTAQEIENLKSHYISMKKEHSDLFDNNTNFAEITVPVNKVSFIHNPTHIYAKEPLVWFQLTELMNQAKERVYVQTPYAVFSNDMYRDFKKIAANVPLFQMQVNSPAVGDNFMASSDYLFNQKKLLDTGVELFDFHGNYSSHGKSGLIDNNLSFVGSYNLDMRSTYVDTETVLVIHGEEFNEILDNYIMDMHAESLKVNTDGSYESKTGVAETEMPWYKQAILTVTSVVFQLIRYLI